MEQHLVRENRAEDWTPTAATRKAQLWESLDPAFYAAVKVFQAASDGGATAFAAAVELYGVPAVVGTGAASGGVDVFAYGFTPGASGASGDDDMDVHEELRDLRQQIGTAISMQQVSLPLAHGISFAGVSTEPQSAIVPPAGGDQPAFMGHVHRPTEEFPGGVELVPVRQHVPTVSIDPPVSAVVCSFSRGAASFVEPEKDSRFLIDDLFSEADTDEEGFPPIIDGGPRVAASCGVSAWRPRQVVLLAKLVPALQEAFEAQDPLFAPLFDLEDAALAVRSEANKLLFSTLEFIVCPASPAGDWLEASATLHPLDGKRVLLEFARHLLDSGTHTAVRTLSAAAVATEDNSSQLSDLTVIIFDVKRQLKVLTDKVNGKGFTPWADKGNIGHGGGGSDKIAQLGGLSVTAEGKDMAMRYMHAGSETGSYDSDVDESAAECDPADAPLSAAALGKACAPGYTGLAVGGAAETTTGTSLLTPTTMTCDGARLGAAAPAATPPRRRSRYRAQQGLH
ncbi:hypothetical protein CYMTET_8207 [Cymbomonas tetramitiformis]|uniref:Uncharacterized protein n=1 Tax=Cymbomonas tetramitiformis TaxID=36881 RepID=A0AAE0GTY4_9CHLO|nr:hypothetical protein CYMTET_8207 [Cymbomonas tetramitiformis]